MYISCSSLGKVERWRCLIFHPSSDILQPMFQSFVWFLYAAIRLRFCLLRQPRWTPCLLPACVCTQSVEVTDCREWNIAMKILLNNIKTESSNQICSLRVVRQDSSTCHCLGVEAPWQGAPFHWHRTEADMTEPHLPLLREKYTAGQISACHVSRFSWCGWNCNWEKVKVIFLKYRTVI